MAISKINSKSIEDLQISADDLATGSITGAKLADSAVTAAKLADSTITNAKLAGSIANDKLANPSITLNGSAVSLGGTASIPTGMFRNIIINGDMSIAQRGTTVTGNTNGNYTTCDRWNSFISSLGTWTITQDTDVPTGQGFAKSFKWDCTTADASPAAGDIMLIQQIFEGQNLQYLKKGTANAESLTLSFWVKCNKTGSFSVSARDIDNSRRNNNLVTINSANTWEKKIITFVGDTTGTLDNDNAGSFAIQWWLDAGSTYTSGTMSSGWETSVNGNIAAGLTLNLGDNTANEFYLTGVQLEVGDSVTPFEHLPTDVNLKRCQRYFYKIESTGTASNNNITTGYTYGTAGVQSNVKMEVTMRATPSFSYDIGTNGLVLYNNVDSITASVPKVYAFAPFGGLMYFDSDLSGTFGASHRPVNVSFNTSPSQIKLLKFDAEL